MKLNERDYVFFILSIIGLIGAPASLTFIIYAHFNNNPTNEPLLDYKFFIILLICVWGGIASYRHIAYCLRHMR